MNILHICNDFTGSKVHANLYTKLDSLLSHQLVYTYLNKNEKIGINGFQSEKTDIIFDDILSPHLRKIYPLKVSWVYRNLIKKVDVSTFQCVHATTLFSDGAIANKLFIKYHIPFIVAVRTTDLGTYLNHGRMFWQYGREVLLNAKKIILINKSFEEILRTHAFSKDLWNEIKGKVVVIPNGIDDFWINNITKEPRDNNHRICFVGTFIKRKNIPRLILAIDSLHKDFPHISLDIIGGGGSIGNEEALVYSMAAERPYIKLRGRINNKNKLRDLLRENCIFAMPSWGETFGLVYIEALTQNLRLLYSKNTGIDGLLDNVGIAVDPMSVESIAAGLRKILLAYDTMGGNSNVDFSIFDWNYIANRYYTIYNSVVNNNL